MGETASNAPFLAGTLTRAQRGARALTLAALSLPPIAVGCAKRPGPSIEPLRVAAAADLSAAFEEMGRVYEAHTGRPVVFSFGSSGLLERQVAQGAPFDVFAAANVAYVEDAVRSGACRADSQALYATGSLVLYVPSGARFSPAAVSDMVDARIAKIAIANPAHAPYGQAAKQAMEHAAIWDRVRDKVVYGQNVRQALQFAESGNADVAIVAASLAFVARGARIPVPPELYDPILQAMVACTGGKAGVDAGRTFIALVMSPEGAATLSKFGFVSPRR